MTGMYTADPYRGKTCPFTIKCWSDDKTDCWQSRICYRAACSICGAAYTGTSGHSLHKRTVEHMEAVRRGDHNNALSKHFLISHPDTNTKDPDAILFKVSVLSRRASNLERYIEEGILIEEALIEDKDEQLNSRGEWGRMSTRRLTVQHTTQR